MNLCVNAVEAMPSGGTLRLRTRSLPDARVELEVTDTGQGMAPEVLAHAFEPFFTTKPVGQGTGLGLAMVYATVKAHGGTVRIESRIGAGTVCVLRFPSIPYPSRPQAVAETPPLACPPLRILLVDDDELIRTAVPPLIECDGHTVTIASGGQEALARLDGHQPVDLVILDLNMPGMSGAETLTQIRVRHPDLPVLLATGFLDAGTEQLVRKDAHCRSIAKPFSMEALHHRIAEAWASKPPGASG